MKTKEIRNLYLQISSIWKKKNEDYSDKLLDKELRLILVRLSYVPGNGNNWQKNNRFKNCV